MDMRHAIIRIGFYPLVDLVFEAAFSDFLGRRKYVPITGGYFAGQHVNGESLSGDVLPGGADWQLERPDGVLEIDALYSIRTSDDQTIIIHNSGIASQADEGGPYVRTIPKFQDNLGSTAAKTNTSG